MSWAAHEFENYFIQRHVGAKASFLAIVLGAQAPDLFTKGLMYAAADPARFHRGWPGVGFTHSLIFGFGLGVAVLAVTRSRSWALGILIGQWAHVLTDVGDSAGTMPFFPFSAEPVAVGMWQHAGSEGGYGDAAAYYSSLGVVWDLLWLVITLTLAWKVLRPTYFRTTIVPADPKVWGWLQRVLRIPERGLLLLYWGFLFYGVARMATWFVVARTGAAVPFDPTWGGPYWVTGHDLSDAGWVEVLGRTARGGVLFAGFLVACWYLFVRRLWDRAAYPAGVPQHRSLRTAVDG